MEEGERTNVATYYFTHQEREEEEKEEEEEEGEDNDDRGTASDAENGNQVDQRENLTRRKRMLHYSTEDIHLLATQVYILSVSIIINQSRKTYVNTCPTFRMTS